MPTVRPGCSTATRRSPPECDGQRRGEGLVWTAARHVTTFVEALARGGYDEANLQARLGTPDARLSTDEQRALWLWRARGRDGQAVLARLFLLESAVPAAEARHTQNTTNKTTTNTLGVA